MSDKFLEIITNKKARFNYEIIETFEAGLALLGTEVKSIRAKKISLQESYAFLRKGEIFITKMNIAEYERGNRFNHQPLRERKVLLHKQEIKKLTGKLQEKGLTLIPLKIYFKNGKVKTLLGLARGKAKYDKRKTIQDRDAKRDLAREMKKFQ